MTRSGGPTSRSGVIRVRAFAKINLTLRVLGARRDGYHELRTMFQSVALGDRLTFVSARGAFEIDCDEPGCPTGRQNLVWRAAACVWRAAGRSGAPRGVRVRIDKRIPMQAGLGGGSADAAAALRALAVLWRVRLDDDQLHATAAALGADVPFFLHGGTSLGVGRGDVLFPLNDPPGAWVVLALPPVGVSTQDAYAWLDRATLKGSRHHSPVRVTRPFQGREKADRIHHALQLPVSELRNDLQIPVVERHPEIGRLITALTRAGATYAAMSGSGSAVFGLFGTERAALRAADTLVRRARRIIVTCTIQRSEYQRLGRPTLARK
jgi:4-diphosphocytidyl-2-C-methyl-D-erythritol kinase